MGLILMYKEGVIQEYVYSRVRQFWKYTIINFFKTKLSLLSRVCILKILSILYFKKKVLVKKV